MRNKRPIIYRLSLGFSVILAAFFYYSQAIAINEESNSFQLQPGDRLEITVYREADLSGVYEVDPAGRINFPLIGEIQAADLEIEQFREQLASRLKEYLVIPQI